MNRRVPAWTTVAAAALLALPASAAPSRTSCPSGLVKAGVAKLTDYEPPGASDYADAFECALRDLCADVAGSKCSGGVLSVPKGTFPVSRTVAMRPSVRIVGVGFASRVVWSGRSEAGAVLFDSNAEPPIGSKAPTGVSQEGVENLLIAAGNPASQELCPSTSMTDGAPRRQAMPGVALRVHGSVGGGPSGLTPTRDVVLSGVGVCGFGTGVRVEGKAASASGEALFFGGNGVALELSGGAQWSSDAADFEANTAAIVIRDGVGSTFYGGAIRGTGGIGVDIESCQACSLEGLQYEANKVDVQLGGGIVRSVGFFRSSGAANVVIRDPAPACPVDGVAFQDFAGAAHPAVVHVDSGCHLSLSVLQSDLAFERSNSSPGGPLPEIAVYGVDGFAPPTTRSTQPLGVGPVFDGGPPVNNDLDPRRASQQLDSVVADSSARGSSPANGLRILSNGRAALGGVSTDAVLAVSGVGSRVPDTQPGLVAALAGADAGDINAFHALDLQNVGLQHRLQSEAPSSWATGAGTALRFVDLDGGVGAVVEAENEGAGNQKGRLVLKTAEAGDAPLTRINVSPEGNVGIGSRSPTAALDLQDGGVVIEGDLREPYIRLPFGKVEDVCGTESGAIEIVPAPGGPKPGTDRVRICVAPGRWQELVLRSAP